MTHVPRGKATGAALLRRHAVARLPLRGECGTSSAARRLRAARRRAARGADASLHVLLVGEPGTLKMDVAKLILYSSERRKRPAAQLGCQQLAAFGSRTASAAREGETCEIDVGKHAARLIADVAAALAQRGGGTLLLRDVHALPAGAFGAVRRLLSAPAGYEGVRVIATASRAVPELTAGASATSEGALTTLRVPPLRVRREDIAAEAGYFLRYARGGAVGPTSVTESGLAALQAHDWPGNEAELQGVMERAVVMQSAGRVRRDKALAAGLSTAALPPLDEAVLWPDPRARRGEQLRYDLLRGWPPLRMLMRADFWPQGLMRSVVVPAFALFNLVLLFGPQARADNAALTIFWAYWWPGILITYPLVGRLWCSFCPFMAYGDMVQRWRLNSGAALKSWPTDALDRYGGWFLFGLFALILEWEEVWLLEDHARLSSALLLLITAGAVVGSALFEKRVWCRHLCPIGGMNGIMAKLAVTEVRAERGVCSATCSSYGCYRGSDTVIPSTVASLDNSEGLVTAGCPLGVHPANLTDNADCVLCGVCIKACPHGSVQLNLRPPAIDLWTTHEPKRHEVSLLFLLLGAVFCHRLPEAAALLGVGGDVAAAVATTAQDAASLDVIATHIAVATVALAWPGLLALGGHMLGNLVDSASSTGHGSRSRGEFLTEAYAWLPLCWLASLSHYLDLGLGEAGLVLPRAARTMGLAGVAESGLLPQAAADPAVIKFCQGGCLSLGILLSTVLLRVLARRPWPAIAPQVGAMTLATVQLWALLV